MKVICDIETDSLDAKRIWVIVCIDIKTGKEYVFREPDLNPEDFLEFARGVRAWIGHNLIGFDVPVIHRYIRPNLISRDSVIDTLVVSRLLNYAIDGGHSLDQWGSRLGIEKPKVEDFGAWETDSETIVNRCTVDCRINLKLYKYFEKHITSKKWKEALRTEHDMAFICKEIHDNGFYFNKEEALEILAKIEGELKELDEAVKRGFPPKAKAIKEITPKLTQFGTLNRSDFRWVKDGDLTGFHPGATFTRIEWKEFNPGSSKQIVERLNAAGWKPTEKTKTHIEAEESGDKEKLERMRVVGWKVSETNLATLPATAPPEASHLVKSLLLRSRRSDLNEWLELISPTTGRVHGNFLHVGTWTHRMAHQHPNLGNIPTRGGNYAKELRALWSAPEGRLLIGVDAESIQIRILAHYMEDERLISAISRGADPHEVNKEALGAICKSRDAAKTFIYAWVLGAGINKVAKILGCTKAEAAEALKNFLNAYPILAHLRKEVLPKDFERGYFEAIDGRLILLPKDKPHKVLSGYLQAGETIVMKKANIIWRKELDKLGIEYKQVNFVHDEWQTEIADDEELAIEVARIQADAIRQVGELYDLKCPLAGSFWNKKARHYTIGRDWGTTH